MLNRKLAAISLLAGLILVSRAESQTVTFTKIADPNSTVKPNGDRPALDAGQVAFLGPNAVTGTWGIYRAQADGAGAPTFIIDNASPHPLIPGAPIEHVDNPEIHAGEVYFTGGQFSGSHALHDGLFSGDGGPIQVEYDAYNNPGFAMPFEPSVTSDGISFRTTGVGSNALVWSQPVFMDSPGSFLSIPVSLPGGGDRSALVQSGENPAQGGGVMSMSLNAAGGSSIAAPWPSGLPSGAGLIFQGWIQDPSGPVGFSATNGLMGVTK